MKIQAQKLTGAYIEILQAIGETQEQAQIAAQMMVKSDARGVATHGSHMLTLIYNRRKVGQLRFPTTIDVLQDKGAIALIDGNDGLGQVAGVKAARLAAQKAKEFGIGMVSIRNTNNVGTLAPFTEMAAREGQISIFCCNASPAMSAWGGMEQFVGTQPFAICVYTGKKLLFSADMATTEVARGKIRKAARDGKPIPQGWALDEEGNPTTDAAAAIKGVLLPIGGPKGSAIALAVDIMSGMISGSNVAPDVRAIHYTEGEAGVGGCFISIDIAAFTPLSEFESRMDSYIQKIRSLKKAKGFDRILLPGEFKQEKEQKSMNEGVELDDATLEALDTILAEINSPTRLRG